MSVLPPLPARPALPEEVPGAAGAHRADLCERGFAHLGEVLAPDLTARVRAELDAHARGCTRPGAYGLICHNPWLHVPVARSLLRGVLAPLALELLDVDEVVLFQDILIAKPAGTDTAVQWHQDYSYWPLDAPAGLTLWIALDHADTDNGCLRYIPGTHMDGEKHPADFFAGVPQPRRPGLAPLEAAAREHEAVWAPVPAGHALAHHPLVWHMSPPNRSRRPRHAWSITWITAAARWAPAHAPHPYEHQLAPRAKDPVAGDTFMRVRR